MTPFDIVLVTAIGTVVLIVCIVLLVGPARDESLLVSSEREEPQPASCAHPVDVSVFAAHAVDEAGKPMHVAWYCPDCQSTAHTSWVRTGRQPKPKPKPPPAPSPPPAPQVTTPQAVAPPVAYAYVDWATPPAAEPAFYPWSPGRRFFDGVDGVEEDVDEHAEDEYADEYADEYDEEYYDDLYDGFVDDDY
jgi:hypothetical protein